MRLYPEPIEPAPGEGFKDDILNRERIGDHLASLVQKIDAPATIVLDAPWGEGKTTFLKMLISKYSSEFPIIYLDAFSNDYMDDPFTCLSGSIASYAETNGGSDKKLDDLKKRFVKYGGRVAARIGAAGFRAASRYLIGSAVDIEDLKKLNLNMEDLDNEIDRASEFMAARIESAASQRAEVQKFRESLQDLCECLTKDCDAGVAARGKNVVFIIDEMDRCRPPFALGILEAVKHLFDVNGVVFIMSTSIPHLSSVVRSAYGMTLDAERYLEKFYHLSIQLPGKMYGKSGCPSRKYIAYLSGSMLGVHVSDAATRTVYCIALHAEMSLRTIERVFANIVLCISAGYEIYDGIMVGICAIKVLDTGLYRKLRSQSASWAEVANCLGIKDWRKYDQYMDDYSVNIWGDFIKSVSGGDNRSGAKEDLKNICDALDIVRYSSER